MKRATAITPKERDLIERAEMVAEYVDPDEKIIGISADPGKSRAANRSSIIKKLIKEFNYKIQMLIPNHKTK